MSIKKIITITIFMILFITFIPFIVNAESKYLYDVLKDEAESGGLAKEYTGEHHDSFTEEPSKKIYHWYATNNTQGNQVLEKNNVIFANHCWQMIRTTDTGGVKMIYNGEAENGKCLANRASHTGYASSTIQNLTANYWYGTDYIYDSETKTFKVSGTTEQVTWNETTKSELIGKYTCKSNSKDESCSSIYLVESYYDSTSAHAIPIVTNSYNYQYGTLQYNVNNSSPAYVGYMYGDVYNYDTITIRKTEDFTKYLTILHMVQPYIGTRYNYSNSVDYGNINADKYTLTGEGFQLDTTENMSKVLGKYTFMRFSGGNSGTSVRYIAGVSGRTLYYISLANGNLLSDYEPIMFGDSITENEDGTYTINNPIPVTLSEWYNSSKNYKNKYTCNDSNITCSNPRYITDTSYASYSYINAGEKIIIGKTRSGLTLTDTLLVRKDELVINSSNYSDYKYTCNTDSITCSKENLRMIESYNNKGYNYISNYNYGSSITWDGEKYTLVDPIEIENYNNLNNLSTHHFMCLSPGDISCTSVAYIYYYTGTGTIYYIKLKDGMTSVNKILNNMFKKNNTNSTIKTGVDAWYKHYLLEDYDKYIEDTIFCNDRSIRLLNGWDPNGGMTSSFLYFKESNVTNDFSCINVADQFSIFNNNAKLTYKVGLVSSPEINALNNSSARNPSYIYRTISPYMFSYNTALNTNINDEGSITKSDVSYGLGVRPAISLKPNIQYLGGNGSRSNPYIIDTRTTYNVNVQIVNETENFDINLEDMTKVYEGEDVIFKVTPITGYKLTNIKVLDSNNNEIEFTNTSNENEYTFTMPASNVTIIPSYKKNRFNISVTVKNEEKDFDINVEDMTSVLVGEELTFKVTPITGYKVNSIQIVNSDNNEVTFTSTSNENEYSFVMPESDVTIIPSYEKVSNSIEVEDNNHTKELTIEVNDISAVVYEDEVKFTIIPEKGYEVDSINIKDQDNNSIDYNKTDNENEYSFIMPPSNVTIKPNYKKVSNSVNVEDNNDTKEIIVEVNDSNAVVYEDTVKFTIMPEDGYELEDIEIIDKNNNKIEYKKTSKDNEYIFTMPETDVVIKPIYKKLPIKENNNIINPLTNNNLTKILLIVILFFTTGLFLYRKKGLSIN